MTEAAAWLRARLSGAPPELLDAMEWALPEDAPSVADALAAGALLLYDALRTGGDAREDALPLLAADALMTHALQAQAEADPASLSGFAERWGAAGRLGALAGAAER